MGSGGAGTSDSTVDIRVGGPDGSRSARRAIPTEVGPIFERAARHIDSVDEQVALDSVLRALWSDRRQPVVLSRYMLQRRLGEGGSGIVYVAHDPELGRSVAIKLLRTRVSSNRSDQLRLFREARAMALLAHPNVVPIFDIGRFSNADLAVLPAKESAHIHPLSHGEHGFFIVMEYVPGRDLDAWLAERRRSWREVLGVFLQAGRGLHAAHERGLLHRDFKPANVLVAEDGRVRVFDFGLAQPEGEDHPDASTPALTLSGATDPGGSAWEISLTASGTIVGTPAYMAPELYGGWGATRQSDQYAFCVALYKAVYGEHPFPRRNDASAIAAKIAGIDRRPVAPLDKRSRPPKWLFQIIQRGLDPDPMQRWPNMAALLDELGRDRGQRLRTAAVIALGGAVGVLGIAGSWGWHQQQAMVCSGAAEQIAGVYNDQHQQEIHLAMQRTELAYAPAMWRAVESRLNAYASEWVQEHAAACEATNVRREQSAAVMDLRMACLERAKIELRAAVDILRTADVAVVRNATEVVAGLPSVSRCSQVATLEQDEVGPADPELATKVQALRVRVAEANVLQRAGKYDRAHAEFQALDERAQGLGYAPVQAEVRLMGGRVLIALGRYDEAVTTLKSSLSRAMDHGSLTTAALSAAELTFVFGEHLQQFEWAHWMADLGLGLAKRLGDTDAETALRNGLGLTLKNQGKYADAQDQLRLAVEMQHTRSGEDQPKVAMLHNNLGGVLAMQGRYAEAEQQHRIALDVWQKAWGNEHPTLAMAYNNIGLVLQKQGKYADAEAQHRIAIELRRKGLGEQHPYTAMSYNNLALALEDQKKYAEAEQHHRTALAILQTALGVEHPNVAVSHNNLGLVLQDQEKYGEAEREHRIALELKQKALGEEHPSVAKSRNNLGIVLQKQRRYGEAEQQFRSALAVWEKAPGEAPDVARAHHNLADVLVARSRPTEAVTHYERALVIRSEPDVLAEDLAATAFALAKLLRKMGRQRHRAIELALRARDALARAEGGDAELLQAIDNWNAINR